MDEEKLIREFSKFWYDRGSWITEYRGIPIMKCPMDMWMMQEIIYSVRPDLIIETGTFFGGSALYYAHVLDTIQSPGLIVTIDPDKKENRANHERIIYVQGSSIDPLIHETIKTVSKKKHVLVILDSLHTKEHVAKELELYGPLVSKESYCIVEDTNIGEPMQAALEYVLAHDNFKIDNNAHKHTLTFNPNGYLARIK